MITFLLGVTVGAVLVGWPAYRWAVARRAVGDYRGAKAAVPAALATARRAIIGLARVLAAAVAVFIALIGVAYLIAGKS